MILFFNFSFLENRSNFVKKFVLLITISSVMLVIILDSNFLTGFLNEKLLTLNYKIIIFSIYVCTFIISGIILLNSTYKITHLKDINIKKSKIYFILIFLIYSILSVTLIITTIQLSYLKNYSNIVFYLSSYISFIASLGFLSILSFKFFQW